MNRKAHPLIQHWSTSDVDPAQRLDYYTDALSNALTPMLVTARTLAPGEFFAEMWSASLGPVEVLRQSGTVSRAVRNARDIERSQVHSYHLILNLTASWNVVHRGAVRLEPGDAIFTDSNYGHELDLLGAYEVVHLRFSEDWVRQWLPVPGVITGRKIARNSRWGSALTAFLVQLNPEVVVEAPLPPRVIADQVGALLALVAAELGTAVAAPAPAVRALGERIRDCIVQRCAEQALTADEVGVALNISTRTLHRNLAACGTTFGACLMKARLELARRMLQSPIFRRLTIAEIGYRCGFVSASHFARVFRKQAGCSPAQTRKDAGWAQPAGTQA